VTGGRNAAMKPYVIRLGDGSLLIEWISKRARFGISLEPDIADSGWYYVNKDGSADIGRLPFTLLEYLASESVQEHLRKIAEKSLGGDNK